MSGPFRAGASLDIADPRIAGRMLASAALSGCDTLPPLLLAVRAGAINLTLPTRGTRMPPLHRLSGRPLCVLLGDDDYQTTGPGGWACAEKLRGWADAAIVHGAGGEAEHYAAAARLTIAHRRFLLVETTGTAAAQWVAFLQQRYGLGILAVLPRGGVHPVTPDQGRFH